jgi:phage terminase large subunit GpA-like protein
VNRQQFQRFIDRDGHCPHCGTTDDTLVPQHRANRGHGGFKAGNQPANVIVLCAAANTLIESDAEWAQNARDYGWKLRRHEDPELAPFYDVAAGAWFNIDNNYGRERAI